MEAYLFLRDDEFITLDDPEHGTVLPVAIGLDAAKAFCGKYELPEAVIFDGGTEPFEQHWHVAKTVSGCTCCFMVRLHEGELQYCTANHKSDEKNP